MHFVEKPGREGLNSTRPIKEGFEWGKAFVQMVWMSQSYDDHNEQTAKSLRVLIYLGLSLTTAIWSRYFCYSYFADGVTGTKVRQLDNDRTRIATQAFWLIFVFLQLLIIPLFSLILDSLSQVCSFKELVWENTFFWHLNLGIRKTKFRDQKALFQKELQNYENTGK